MGEKDAGPGRGRNPADQHGPGRAEKRLRSGADARSDRCAGNSGDCQRRCGQLAAPRRWCKTRRSRCGAGGQHFPFRRIYRTAGQAFYGTTRNRGSAMSNMSTNLAQKVDSEMLSLQQASVWASEYLKKQVTSSNIAYLVQYGKIPKFGSNGSTLVSKADLQRYYNS